MSWSARALAGFVLLLSGCGSSSGPRADAAGGALGTAGTSAGGATVGSSSGASSMGAAGTSTGSSGSDNASGASASGATSTAGVADLPGGTSAGGASTGGASSGGSTPSDDPPITPGGVNDYPYVSDLGNGMYRNPVLVADYSDPDPIRVGSDYYLVASSFNVTPGLPILHSKDLVNWRLVTHALASVPGDRFSQPQHGQGVWAPSIREHGGTYYIAFPVYCKPADDGACAEEGIWVVTASAPTGPWNPAYQLLAAKGVIDPCLFWDDDGKAYLVHAYALSRAGISDRVDIRPMTADGKQITGAGQMVFSDPTNYSTLEGPKMYKRNGYYYILAPAGGVVNGFEAALRSKAVYGPYEARVVLQQGSTAINGPHQGGIVDTPDGTQVWFLHFQDAGAYGRILHLNPVTWTDDWPLMGVAGANGIRQPVVTALKPNLPQQPIQIPQTSDDFGASDLGLQWQWHANPVDSWFSLSESPGSLRLFPQAVANADLTLTPNLLMQKVPARSFNIDSNVTLTGTSAGTSAGLVVWGDPATALLVAASGTGSTVTLVSGGKVVATDTVASGAVHLRVSFANGASCRFSYGPASGSLKAFTQTVQMAARKSSWIGVKVGVVALSSGQGTPAGHADFDAFTFSKYAAP